MKTKLASAFLLAAALVAVGVHAQTASSAAISTPAVSATPPPNQTVYAPRLPSVQELTNVASAQGLTIDRIEQTNSQVTVVYKYSNGQLNTVSYQLLPASGNPSAPVAVDSGPATGVYAGPAYDYYYGGYYPWPGYWYPPVGVRIGVGFGYRYPYHYGHFGYRHGR